MQPDPLERVAKEIGDESVAAVASLAGGLYRALRRQGFSRRGALTLTRDWWCAQLSQASQVGIAQGLRAMLTPQRPEGEDG